jgi:hypothetical protein
MARPAAIQGASFIGGAPSATFDVPPLRKATPVGHSPQARHFSGHIGLDINLLVSLFS